MTFPFAGDMEGHSQTFPKVQVPNELERVTTVTYDSAGNALSSQEEKVWNKLVSGFPAADNSLFTFGTLDFTGFQAVLELLKTRSDTKIVSNPRITTLNNMMASIMVGKIVPIPKYEYSKETGNQVISGYADQNVGITLIVTPTINEQGYVTLKINPKVEDIIGSTGPNGERPVIATRSAETTVMIKDGRTLVIGGLISENKLKIKKGIPFLGSLPVLDLFFGNKQDTLSRTELLVFITPHIINEEEFSSEEMAKIENSLRGISEKSTRKEKGAKK
jgi:type II secretory pathway component GspD/PulD (secretin)